MERATIDESLETPSRNDDGVSDADRRVRFEPLGVEKVAGENGVSTQVSSGDREVDEFVEEYVINVGTMDDETARQRQARFSARPRDLENYEIDRLIEDLRAEVMELSVPQVNLESWTKSSVLGIFLVFVLAWLFGVVVQICFYTTHGGFQVYSTYLLLGFLLTFSFTTFAFLMISFTPRMCIRCCKKQIVLPQQGLIVIIVWYNFFLGINGYNIWEYWNSFHLAVKASQGMSGDAYSTQFWQVITAGLNDSSIVSIIAPSTCLYFIFWCTMLNLGRYFTIGIIGKFEALDILLFEKSKRREHTLIHRSAASSSNSILVSAEEEGGTNIRQRNRFKSVLTQASAVVAGRETKIQEWRDVKKKRKMHWCSMYYCCCCCCCCSETRCADSTSSRGVLRRGFSCRFYLYIAVYYVLTLKFASDLSFIPSSVPFMGILTMLRVCLATNPENGRSFCDYDSQTHSRIIAILVMGVLEVGLFVIIHVVSKRALRVLKKVPYAHNRSNFLGHSFTQASTIIMWLMVYSLALWDIFAPSLDSLTHRTEFPNNNITVDNIVTVLDPLYIVGSSSTTPSYFCIYLVQSTWIVLFAYAYLPVDSVGCKGWWVPSKRVVNFKRKENIAAELEINDNGELVNESGESLPPTAEVVQGSNDKKDAIAEDTLRDHFSENPLYIAREEEFDRILGQNGLGVAAQFCGVQVILEDEELDDYQNDNIIPTTGIQLKTLNKHLGAARSQRSSVSEATEAEIGYDRTLAGKRISQVLSHVLVLDTEIAMFNFAAITYVLGNKKKPLSQEKEQELIGDSKYVLLEHIVDAETDTHAIVCVSEDRVVISFRGTASSSNVKTDLDYNWSVFDEAQSVEPLPSTNPMEQKALQKQPQVHTGFLAAYRAVQQKIRDIASPYIFKRRKDLSVKSQKRAVFVTGHSLGGGLAVLCAFDLGCYINAFVDERAAICCTTYGSPRIGNYSFVQRYKRIVPTTKRFVMASDIIPKTPPRLLRGPYHGYHHVGLELMLDLDGNLLIGPNLAERLMLHGLKRPTRKTHFCSRYCLGLIMWAARMKTDAKIWVVLVNRMVKFAKNDIALRDQELVRMSTVFYNEGVIWELEKKELRNTGVQTRFSKLDCAQLDSESLISLEDTMEASADPGGVIVETTFADLRQRLELARSTGNQISPEDWDEIFELVQTSQARLGDVLLP
eukprot:CAMPEP_0203748546 /NCGR_PEP_ID=MMETSP0098-20131031/3402_1 /ASSEMBLY_ACC=CAM_ASM_000208 /TAXON_ID=96639 /ORGANISM=" , Strain NY0313808BC1" /LENGTH=1186 /DNA_ID=CAMNT_0050637321 /DNA_START=910 /DNA_END=4470 /DNA_ORIENTATION=+